MADEFARQIDPGNEVSRMKPHSTEWIISLLRKYPEMTLARGEGWLLLAEIDRLNAEVKRLLQPGHGSGVWMGIGEEPGR